MTVAQAIQALEGRTAGLLNGQSVKYAQILLLPDEEVVTAVIANIQTSREKFPGVVVITDQRVLAVCGLPGIRRSVTIPVEELDTCEETSTAIYYKAVFTSRHAAFNMTIDPDLGEKFSPYIAQLNGEEYEEIQVRTSALLNPNLARSKARNKLRKEREKSRAISKELQRQKDAQARFMAAETTDENTPVTAQETESL